MMSTEQSGVIACHAISTIRPEAIPLKSSPFKAWPAIIEWNRYYALPMIDALYRPDILPNLTDVLLNMSLEDLIKLMIRWCPNLEQFMSQFMPMYEELFQKTGEYYQSHFGIDYDKRRFQISVLNVLNSLGGDDANKDTIAMEFAKLFQAPNRIAEESDDMSILMYCIEELNKMLSPEETYSMAHEGGHLYSFTLTRPAITHFKATWSAIENLLQQAAFGSDDGFWDKLNDLNSELKSCLSNSLVLEELRANLWALRFLPPEMQTTFINRIYGEESEKSRNKESEIFYSLQFLTGRHLIRALIITLLVECLDPLNPEGQLEQVQNSLKAASAETWSDEQWTSWFQQWNKLDSWETLLNINHGVTEYPTASQPKVMLTGRVDGNVMTSCAETMRLSLFHESIRQQLDNLKRLRTLTCPFKGQRHTCCGFGHSLQNIWAAVPNQERRRLKPPSKVCLNYTLNSPH
jgi:hypothetical protein